MQQGTQEAVEVWFAHWTGEWSRKAVRVGTYPGFPKTPGVWWHVEGNHPSAYTQEGKELYLTREEAHAVSEQIRLEMTEDNPLKHILCVFGASCASEEYLDLAAMEIAYAAIKELLESAK